MKNENKWIPEYIDFSLSPYTGLTRESWISAGIYLLKGIFKNVSNEEMPIVVKRTETEVTYPHFYSEGKYLEREKKAEIFEGLARSLLIASVIIHEKSDITLNGIILRDYYKQQILKSCCIKESRSYVGTYTELRGVKNNSNLTKCFQQTVETCALVIGLDACRNEIWETYSKSEKDGIASFLKNYAENATAPKNWRLFNMLVLAFLSKEGYEIDDQIMGDHAQAILSYYAGNGWYRDGQNFDYYSCWAFNLYGPIWCSWYGYEKLPWVAAKFEEYSNKLMETYFDMFDNDGFTNMWGRSCIYRNATTSAFYGNLLLNNSRIAPGLARRITSGSLLQFLTRDDFLNEDVPSLGFYGQFTPLVQGYSCAISPFWLGKAFLCLKLSKEHPFWTEKEAENSFDKLCKHGVKESFLAAPGLCFTNHKDNGETILRTAKVFRNSNDLSGMQNYAKLCYNTKFPWEATPERNQHETAVESMMYVINDGSSEENLYPNAVFLSGLRGGVLYRRACFNYAITKEKMWIQGMYYADFPVSLGILRVDKLVLYKRPVTVTLGSYGFPDNGTDIIYREGKAAKAIILKGKDHIGRIRQMAVTIYSGWQKLDLLYSHLTNPDSERSIIIYCEMRTGDQLYDVTKPYFLISQTITKSSDDDFTDEELFPVKSLKYTDPWNCGAYGPLELCLHDGSVRNIDFSCIEGNMSL